MFKFLSWYSVIVTIFLLCMLVPVEKHKNVITVIQEIDMAKSMFKDGMTKEIGSDWKLLTNKQVLDRWNSRHGNFPIIINDGFDYSLKTIYSYLMENRI